MTDKIVMSKLPDACVTETGLDNIHCVRPLAEEIDNIMKEDPSYEAALLDAQQMKSGQMDGIIDDAAILDKFVLALKQKINPDLDGDGPNAEVMQEAELLDVAKDMAKLWAQGVGFGYVGRDFKSADQKELERLTPVVKALIEAQKNPTNSRLKTSLRDSKDPAKSCQTYGAQFAEIIGQAVEKAVADVADIKAKVRILKAMEALLKKDTSQEIAFAELPAEVQVTIQTANNQEKAEKLLKGELAEEVTAKGTEGEDNDSNPPSDYSKRDHGFLLRVGPLISGPDGLSNQQLGGGHGDRDYLIPGLSGLQLELGYAIGMGKSSSWNFTVGGQVFFLDTLNLSTGGDSDDRAKAFGRVNLYFGPSFKLHEHIRLGIDGKIGGTFGPDLYSQDQFEFEDPTAFSVGGRGYLEAFWGSNGFMAGVEGTFDVNEYTHNGNSKYLSLAPVLGFIMYSLRWK